LPHDRRFVSVIWRPRNGFSSMFGDIHTRVIWTWMFQNSFAIAIFWFPVQMERENYKIVPHWQIPWLRELHSSST
jgi:hypothetical protein